MQIKPAQITLNALRDGQIMNELAAAIHEATCAVRDHNKPAEITLTIRLKPLKGVSAGLKESPIAAEAEVSTKLPKPDLPTTLFYIDGEGNPTQSAPGRQSGLGLTVAQHTGV